MTELHDPAKVEEALLAYAEEEFDYGDFGAFTNYYDIVPGSKFDVPGLGEVTLVDFHDYDQNKSYDGWSEKVWQVWNVNNVLYRIDGEHTSYTGTKWNDDMIIVKPSLRTVIDYVPATLHEYM